MSSANAAAKKRRAPGSIEPPQPIQQKPAQPGQNVNSAGLTLPQVIALIDKRLVNLETFVSESRKSPHTNIPVPPSVTATTTAVAASTVDLSEFNTRFDLLADEIANMKNIVLSLQSYTMDVNKVLMEERVKILSEVSNENSGLFNFAPTEEEPDNLVDSEKTV